MNNFGVFVVMAHRPDGSKDSVTWATEEGKARLLAHDIACGPAAKPGTSYLVEPASQWYTCMGDEGLKFFCSDCGDPLKAGEETLCAECLMVQGQCQSE